MCFLISVIYHSSVLALSLDIQSKYVGVYNADNMELLYGKNTNEKISIASITKIMTAVVSVENITDLNEKVTINYDLISNSVSTDLAVCGIVNGQVLSYYDLVATTLIPSGADSALYLANTVCGDYNTFIQKMNEKAKEIGMENTSFDNPVGIDSVNNYSTINDVAKLLNYAMQNDVLVQIMSTETYTTSDGNITVGHTIDKSAYRNGIRTEHILGGKTGTTGDAGICLASYAKDEDINLIAVVTGASMYSARPHNIIDTEKILGYIKENYTTRDVISTDEKILSVSAIGCLEDEIKFSSGKSIPKYTGPIQKENLEYKYKKTEDIAPLMIKDAKVGEVEVYYNGEYLDTVELKLAENVNFEMIEWAKKNLLGI